MYEPNVSEVLRRLAPTDLVLDVGGWACPFNRADWVIDAMPFESRGFYRTFGGPASQGGEREHFTAASWVQRDICDRDPWPFRDKQFDFAICSHTLEDIRDPLGVCRELMRVAKRGYIEVPSREWETCRGMEHPRLVGLSHHRWLIDIEGNRVRFTQKYHLIHSHWKFSLPRSHLRRVTGERAVQWLWWDDRFEVEEAMIHGLDNLRASLAEYVRKVRPYPGWQVGADAAARKAGGLVGRAYRGVMRRVTGRG